MNVKTTGLPGVLVIEPDQLEDSRGAFYESFRHSLVAEAAGHPFTLAQANFSVSRKGVLRGLHGVAIPPGQAKIVTCHRGALLDFVVDVRLGSPTFGEYVSHRLTAESGRAVYLAEGLAHGFVALEDDSCIGYLCSTEYVPGTQLDLNPLDPLLSLPWDVPGGRPLLSEKDAAAPTLREAADLGLLPTYQDCLALYERLAAGR